MKTFSPGLSDSIASVLQDPQPCPHCDSSSHIAGGLCVGCLLEAGLARADEDQSETLTELLANLHLPDQNWRLGNYEILEEIGRGGMGVIYRARQRHSRRIVAVKRVLSYHADSRETLARFRREAQAAASLDHPNILPIYEVGESEDGLPFFSMKFAPGGNLQEVGPALRNDLRQGVALVAKIARAVQYAHSKGILHRDLKPGNILLDGRGEPLVSDFGLAKWLDTTSDLTRTLTIFGTPGYIAPEQASAAAAELKPTADVYSLGAILFDLLAGRPPFLGAHALSVIRQAAESPAPKLRTLSKLADRDLETICSRCLDRDPKLRYPSAHDLADDLERWLEGRPIIARPVGLPVRTWRWSKRNPKLAASLAATLIIGATGLGVAITNSRLSGLVRNVELAQRSVVVMPFEDLDDLSATSNSAKSATEGLMAALTGTKGIRSSSSEVHFDEDWSPEEWKAVGSKTGARMVLAGSVRQRQGKQRITLHLIETASGQVLTTWLHELSPDGATEFANACVRRISGFLSGTDTPIDCLLVTSGNPNATGGTSNPTARGFYERGKDYLSRNNLPDQLRAINSLQKATELDPCYGQAHAFLATACELRATTDLDPIWPERAEKAEAAALKHAPRFPETHRANAANLQRRAHRRAAIDGYLTAYELDPSDGRAAAILGHSYDALGRPDLAILWYEKANRREKRDLYADNIASAWLSLAEYAKAETLYRAAIISRSDLPVGDLGLITVALFRGDHEAARKQCEVVRANYKDNPEPVMMAAVVAFFSRNFVEADTFYREALAVNRAGGVEFLGSVRFLSALGFMQKASGIQASEGKTLLDEARALDEKEVSSAPESPERLYSLAATFAALDDSEAAITGLNKAVAAGWIDYRSIEFDPRFDSLRDTQAFKDTLTGLTNKVQKMRRQQPGRELASNAN
jgi:serine/threonine protein kinase/tetratricopeptide (TPR) repeat protein